jgi:diguanylate cyclase (GGDEF)-like protein/PAS domain S-box-containing protein
MEDRFVVTRENLAALVALVDEVVVAFDELGTITFVNRAVKTFLGYEPESMIGRNVIEVMHPDDLEEFARGWDASLRKLGDLGQQPDRRVLHADGSWATFSIDFYAGDDVAPFGAGVATLRPTDRTTGIEKELRERLANEDRLVKLASTFVGLPLGEFEEGVEATLFQVGSLHGVGVVALFRRAGDRLVRTHEWSAVQPPPHGGTPAFPILGTPFVDPEREVDVELATAPQHPYLDALRAAGCHSLVTIPMVADGALSGLLACASLRPGVLRQASYRAMLRSAVGVLGEAHARHAAEELLAYEARTDSLTGLGNRWAFTVDLAEALARVGDGVGDGFSVLLLDVDRFKVVNDSLGHLVGDQLLGSIARRLRAATGPRDRLARFGGDEIIVLLDGHDDRADALRRAQQLVAALDEPFEVAGHEFTATVSGGLAVAEPGMGADELLRRADAAMFQAKERGRRRIEVFDDILHHQVNERLQRESDLQRAVRQMQLVLHYQPEVHLGSRQVVAVEALLRWYHPSRGLLEAGEFIEIAEESGTIVELGLWAIEEACRQLAAWQQDGLRLVMRANLSARQITQPGLVERLEAILAETAVDADDLCLEITETALMLDPVVSRDVLHRIADLGIQLAIDDFGTGYSSLAHLKRFPVQVLKIDRSFVQGLGQDPDDDAIVRAILSLAGSLGLAVTAEGVETDHQRRQLLAMGCERAQGYLFSAAVPAPEVEAMLRGHVPLPVAVGASAGANAAAATG